MSISVASLVSLAEFFLRTPTQKAELDFADKSWALLTAVVALPQFSAWEASGEVLVKIEGWDVTKDPVTGHIATLIPPPYVAPARQSAQDFNLHQGDST